MNIKNNSNIKEDNGLKRQVLLTSDGSKLLLTTSGYRSQDTVLHEINDCFLPLEGLQ